MMRCSIINIQLLSGQLTELKQIKSVSRVNRIIVQVT